MRTICKSIARPAEAPKPRPTEPEPQRFGRWRSLASLPGHPPEERQTPAHVLLAGRIPLGSLLACALLSSTALAELEDSGPLFPGRKYESGEKPEVVAIGDMNQDGIGDLVVGNSTGFGTKLRVFLGAGDGTVSLFAAYLGGIIRDLDLVDLDGDGDLDVVMVTQFGGVDVRRGAGNGALGPALMHTFGSEPWSAAVADLNGNGIPDLAVVDRTENNIHVLLGVGDATFGAPTVFTCGVDPMSIAVGDLNGDTALDLAVANSGSADTSILLGVGDGTFRAPSTLGTGQSTRAVVLEDFDEDGWLDLAALVDTFPDLASIYLGFGDGTFGPPLDLPLVGSSPVSLVTTDFDSDGHVDLAASTEAYAEVLLGRGDGSFDPVVPYPSAAKRGLAAGDLSGDGFPDLAIASVLLKDVTVLLGAGDGTLIARERLLPNTAIEQPQRADVNGDSLADLVFLDDQGLWISPGDGNGNYGTPVLAVGGIAGEYLLRDLDADGALDLIVAPKLLAQGLLVSLGAGDGTFGPTTSFLGGTAPRHPLIADFNGDSNLDIVFQEAVANELVFLPGNGNGTLGPPVSAPITTGSDLDVADFDNDQVLDVVVIGFGELAQVMLGNGDGTFSAAIGTLVGPPNSSPIRIHAADFDGDGNADIATACDSTEDARILLGNGDGTFAAPLVFALDSRPGELGTADVNADGSPDFVLTTDDDAAFVVFGSPGGPFTASSYAAEFNTTYELLLTDFNEDGSIDIVTRSWSSQGLAVLYNQRTTSGPSTYCTPKTSSAGCISMIAASSSKAPESGLGDFSIDASNVQEGMNGLLFTSLSGAAALPFNGGTLCMNPPLKRGPIMNAGGSVPGGCAGSFTTVVNDGLMIPMGLDAGPGGQAHYQYFYRDPQNGPGNLGSALSDAIEVCFL